MKISYMLKREDFYDINKKTLELFYKTNHKMRLYVYPRLNAIVTINPSDSVLEYLKSEYCVNNNTIKKVLAQLYTMLCMKSFGILATKVVNICCDVSRDTLIYPCNKKYRIFNFKENIVSVIAKHGFGRSDLEREMQFRIQAHNPSFVPKLISVNDNGYSERIIDGRPLARITDDYESIKHQAYDLFKSTYSKSEIISSSKYIDKLYNEIIQITPEKSRLSEKIIMVAKELESVARSFAYDIEVCFSHGDLQSGNIWVENKSGKIYIIDWESWGYRSVWYDYETLYHGLRPNGVQYFINNTELGKYQIAIVFMEDLIFQLTELNSLPNGSGVDLFEEYLNSVISWCGKQA